MVDLSEHTDRERVKGECECVCVFQLSLKICTKQHRLECVLNLAGLGEPLPPLQPYQTPPPQQTVLEHCDQKFSRVGHAKLHSLIQASVEPVNFAVVRMFFN